jgi:predicted acyl esterase
MRHALLSLLAVASLHAAEPPKLDFGTVREEHLMIPMRDGKRLSAYVFFPVRRTQKWPAIFEQRYARHLAARGRAKRPPNSPRQVLSSPW